MTGEPPKNKHRGTPGFLIKFFQLALYIPIQVAFIPIAIVGLIDVIFKEMRNSKKLGVSFSAIQALQLCPVSVDFPGPVPEHVWLCEELTRARITPRVMPPVDLSLRLGAMAGTRRQIPPLLTAMSRHRM